MKPIVKPALRCLWRDDSTLQFGVDPQRAVVLTGLGRDAVKVLDMLDGTRDGDTVVGTARARGVPEATTRRLLDLLTRAGVLDDASSELRPPRSLEIDDLERLRPELASMCLQGADTDTGMRVLARRRAAEVRVHGAGRVGIGVASLLAAAGVGRVAVSDPGWVRRQDITPLGYTDDDVGKPRRDAAASVLRRTAPTTEREPGHGAPDLVVLAPASAIEPSLADELLRDNVPHLVTTVRDTVGIVGPLVVPGRTSCLRCQELHRRDRDPAWPRLLAQLCRPHRGVAACDMVLATAVSAQAVSQALAYLDARQAEPATLCGTLEIALPDWRWRRRTWPLHPECGCGWQREYDR